MVLVALHRAFEDIADAQFLADLLGVDVLTLKGEGGVARDDKRIAYARKLGREVLSDTIGEIILAPRNLSLSRSHPSGMTSD